MDLICGNDSKRAVLNNPIPQMKWSSGRKWRKSSKGRPQLLSLCARKNPQYVWNGRYCISCIVHWAQSGFLQCVIFLFQRTRLSFTHSAAAQWKCVICTLHNFGSCNRLVLRRRKKANLNCQQLRINLFIWAERPRPGRCYHFFPSLLKCRSPPSPCL